MELEPSVVRRGCLQISVWKVTLEDAVGPVAMLPKILVVAEPMLVFVASESSLQEPGSLQMVW